MYQKIVLVALIIGCAFGVPLIEVDDNLEEAADRTQAQLVCYEYHFGVGRAVKIGNKADDLRPYNLYKKAASCCFAGVWVLYESMNFNHANLEGLSFYGYGEPDFCTDFNADFYKKAASARLVSDPKGIGIDSLSLFKGDFFNGYHHTFIKKSSVPFVDHGPTGMSAVVTGFSSWTVYTSLDGAGECACLHPKRGGVPGFYTDRHHLGHMAGKVMSVRKGCYCSTFLNPPK